MYHHVSRFLLKVHQAMSWHKSLLESISWKNAMYSACWWSQPTMIMLAKQAYKKELLRPQKKIIMIALKSSQLSRKLQSVMKDWIVLSLHLYLSFFIISFNCFLYDKRVGPTKWRVEQKKYWSRSSSTPYTMNGYYNSGPVIILLKPKRL